MDFFESQLSATERAPQEARSFLRSTLQTWSLDGCGDITELLVSELVSNTVLHVGNPLTVRIGRSADTIRVEVDDDSPERPLLQMPDPGHEHGRGLFLVDALATDWGTEVHPDDGKTVWFELDTSTGEREAHGSHAAGSAHFDDD
jgi:anti-sigma regulatory factor (Ser/Thr protein kinase)